MDNRGDNAFVGGLCAGGRDTREECKEDCGGARMTLDHIDNLFLSREQVAQHTNELNSLRYLAVGLHFLVQTVAGIGPSAIQPPIRQDVYLIRE